MCACKGSAETAGRWVDPIGSRRIRRVTQRLAEVNAITFDKAAEEYIAANEAGWTNAKHASQWRSTLKTYATPVIGDLPVSEITAPLVLQILRPI